MQSSALRKEPLLRRCLVVKEETSLALKLKIGASSAFLPGCQQLKEMVYLLMKSFD